MTVYTGVDFHPHSQKVAYCDTEVGEIMFRSFRHSDREAIRMFYQGLPKPAVVGVEATGGLDWFEELIFENGHKLLVGHPFEIRRRALSRHKSDKRDAETLLDLLMTGEFPTIWRRSETERNTLRLLQFRSHLVKQRTSLSNQLQALARKAGLPKFKVKTKSGRSLLIKTPMDETSLYLRENLYALFDDLTRQIDSVEAQLKALAAANEKAQLLMTHSGIGVKTALVVAATLGDAKRFNNTRQIVAFVGLDPLDRSSGERQRTGRISKRGSRICRHFLGQAAARSQDKQIRESYLRISSRRGKAVAKVAAARKLLVNCSVMLRDSIDYEELSRRRAKLACT